MRFPRSQLTRHAEIRLEERFQISANSLLELLNGQQGKKTGVSSKTHLMHRMLWSPVDKQMLVAIQDAITGSVLTLLTLEMYQSHYAERITDQRIRRTINKMVHAGLAPPDMWMPGDTEDYVTVYAQVADSPRILPLGRWRGQVDSADLSQLGKQESFWRWVAEQVVSRGNSVDNVEQVTAKFSGGDYQPVVYIDTPGYEQARAQP